MVRALLYGWPVTLFVGWLVWSMVAEAVRAARHPGQAEHWRQETDRNVP